MDTMELRRASTAVYLATEKGPADDLSRLLMGAAQEIEKLRGEEIHGYKPIVSLGFDKNGEADYRINMSIAALDRPKFKELCELMPWTIKEALTLWLDHGPASKEMAQAKSAQSAS